MIRYVWDWYSMKKNNSCQSHQAEIRIQIWFMWLNNNLKKQTNLDNFKISKNVFKSSINEFKQSKIYLYIAL